MTWEDQRFAKENLTRIHCYGKILTDRIGKIETWVVAEK